MPDVNTPVEASSTPTPNFEPETYTPEEHTAWIEKGTIPLAKTVEPPPTTKEDVTDSSTEEKPVVKEVEATATKTQQQQQEHKGKGADARKAELNAEIRELIAKRDAIKAEATPPAKVDVSADPSPAQAKLPKVEKPAKPTLSKFGDIEGETWEQFEGRKQQIQDDYTEKLVEYRLAEDRRQRETERIKAETDAVNKRIEESWQTRVEAARSKHADFADVAFSKDLPISPVMDGFILDSDVGPEILYYLGQNLPEGKAIAAMPPYKAARALVLIEKALLDPPAAPPVVEKKPAVVTPITKAAKPATDLKATNAAPLDDVKAAIEAGDFAAFQERQNARDIARRKKG